MKQIRVLAAVLCLSVPFHSFANEAKQKPAFEQEVAAMLSQPEHGDTSVYQDIAESIGLLQAAVRQAGDRNAIFLARHDVDIKIGGRIRQEGFHFDSPLTFRSSYNDRYTFQRSKYNFDINSTFGRRTFGGPAVESEIRVTAFNVWDNYDVYTPVVLEPVAFSGHNYIRKAEIGEHHHDGVTTNAYLEKGFVKVNFDQLAHTNIKSSLKAGYFPYKVGRGLSLGDYYGGAIDYLGWAEKGDVGNTAQWSPGIVASIGNGTNFSAEAYYSKWKKRSQGPDYTREETRAKRLDRDVSDDPKYIQRGYGADRDLFAVKAKYTHLPQEGNDFSLYVEPYGVFVNAPELQVEFEGDASAKLFTMGCMAEWKRGNWRVNVEVATQMGHQQMHAIDRNHIILDDAYYLASTGDFADDTGEIDPAFAFSPDQMIYPAQDAVGGRLDITMGRPAKYHSHVLLGITKDNDLLAGELDHTTTEFLPYRAYHVSDDLRHINSRRGIEEQGQPVYMDAPTEKNDTHTSGERYIVKEFTNDDEFITTFNKGLYAPYTFKSGIDTIDTTYGLVGARPSGTLFNANIPFAGGRRFRDAYKIQLRGFMAMADVSYTFPGKGVTVSAAVGHVSGDDYPFNDEKGKVYNAFVPLRDANYEGYAVKSYGVLAARKIARPSTFSDQLMYAPNNFESISNLQYIGVGTMWQPLKDKEKLTIQSNALYFWEDRAPFKWDKSGSRDFGTHKMNGIWQKAIDDLHFTGWQTNERASSNLGLELNTVVTWRPIKNLEARVLFATFVPGQLYRDVDGTPNAYAVRVDQDGDFRFDSLGHQAPFGGMFRLTYWF